MIIDNQKLLKNISFIERDYVFYDDLLKLNKIVSFIGPRRVGKTFLMFQFVHYLLERKYLELEQIVFIDFSLFSGQNIDYKILISDFKEVYPDKTPFFVFDEVQDINNFKEFVLSVFGLGYKIFLSGSNSKLLSSELSTHFRGRVFEYQVMPLNFKEVLRFKGFDFKKRYSSDEIGILKNFVHELMEFGTFPEILLSENNLFKLDNLKTYLDVLLYKDLIERYSVDNEVALKYLIKSLSVSFTKNVNINKIYNELKSQNLKIGKSTLYEYYEYVKNIFYVNEVENFYNSKSFKKVFLYNIGFNKIFGNTHNLGQSFENIVFYELFTKYKKVFFKKNGSEVDFYVPEIDLNLQVCFDLNKDNYIREVNGLQKTNNNILVYFQKSIDIKMENIKIMNFFEFVFEFIY